MTLPFRAAGIDDRVIPHAIITGAASRRLVWGYHEVTPLTILFLAGLVGREGAMTTRYCPVCNGAGFVRTLGRIVCPDCGGAGMLTPNAPCPACNGRGNQNVDMHRVCQQCKGTGMRIPEPQDG